MAWTFHEMHSAGSLVNLQWEYCVSVSSACVAIVRMCGHGAVYPVAYGQLHYADNKPFVRMQSISKLLLLHLLPMNIVPVEESDQRASKFPYNNVTFCSFL